MKKILIILLLLINTLDIFAPTLPFQREIPIYIRQQLYDNVWGTFYYAERKQCDDTPLITGSGYRIDTTKLLKSERILAISQDMLLDLNRFSMLKNKHENRFRGKIQYGDTIWIESPKNKHGDYIYPAINGMWRVEDSKNKRYRKSIDFLVPRGDMSLFNNDSTFCGIFRNLKIYSVKKTHLKNVISFYY